VGTQSSRASALITPYFLQMQALEDGRVPTLPLGDGWHCGDVVLPNMRPADKETALVKKVTRGAAVAVLCGVASQDGCPTRLLCWLGRVVGPAAGQPDQVQVAFTEAKGDKGYYFKNTNILPLPLPDGLAEDLHLWQAGENEVDSEDAPKGQTDDSETSESEPESDLSKEPKVKNKRPRARPVAGQGQKRKREIPLLAVDVLAIVDGLRGSTVEERQKTLDDLQVPELRKVMKGFEQVYCKKDKRAELVSKLMSGLASGLRPVPLFKASNASLVFGPVLGGGVIVRLSCCLAVWLSGCVPILPSFCLDPLLCLYLPPQLTMLLLLLLLQLSVPLGCTRKLLRYVCPSLHLTRGLESS
jgi:hypothetical protein